MPLSSFLGLTFLEAWDPGKWLTTLSPDPRDFSSKYSVINSVTKLLHSILIVSKILHHEWGRGKGGTAYDCIVNRPRLPNSRSLRLTGSLH